MKMPYIVKYLKQETYFRKFRQNGKVCACGDWTRVPKIQTEMERYYGGIVNDIKCNKALPASCAY